MVGNRLVRFIIIVMNPCFVIGIVNVVCFFIIG